MTNELKTVRCSLTPVDGLRLLGDLERRQGAVSLVITPNGVAHSKVEFEVWDDGVSLAHDITLYADGTWSMNTEVPL